MFYLYYLPLNSPIVIFLRFTLYLWFIFKQIASSLESFHNTYTLLNKAAVNIKCYWQELYLFTEVFNYLTEKIVITKKLYQFDDKRIHSNKQNKNIKNQMIIGFSRIVFTFYTADIFHCYQFFCDSPVVFMHIRLNLVFYNKSITIA